MEKKIIWLFLSFLVVLSLLLSSCAPAEPTTSTRPTTPTVPTGAAVPAAPATPTTPTIPATPIAEVPRYGGTFTFALPTEPVTFDDAYRSRASTLYELTNMAIMAGDWAKGLAGSGEEDFYTTTGMLALQTGEIAESWEVADETTVIYHIRKGIYWAVDPNNAMSRLVNGRELTAYDVEFTFKRNFNLLPDYPEPKAYTITRLTQDEQPVSITVPDKWTVVVKSKPGFLGALFKWTAMSISIIAPEVIKSGKNFTDPKNYVSNGPFMLKDYVSASAVTFVKNPNYWRKDPVGPGRGQQLPYLDGVKALVIPDASTRQAGLRTGKLDHLGGRDANVNFENAQDLLKTNPWLQKAKVIGGASGLSLRVDKPELPWYDKRVRQALHMTLDRDTIVRDYYKGEAEIFNSPVLASRGWRTVGAYIPLAQLPASAQELYRYNPVKAKQLLAEAGYPKAFTMEVIALSAKADEVSIIKEQFAKIGVVIDIQVKEAGVFTSISDGKAFKHTIYGNMPSSSSPANWLAFRPELRNNTAQIDDPIANEAILEFARYYMIEDEKAYPIIGKFVPYAVEQAWYLEFPTPYAYTLWWPWVKNYHGEWNVGDAHYVGFTRYIWIDQALKKSMGF